MVRIVWVRLVFCSRMADGMKSLTKEDVVPHAADKAVHFLAPVVLVIAAFSLYAVLPIGQEYGAGQSGRGSAVLFRGQFGDGD